MIATRLFFLAAVVAVVATTMTQQISHKRYYVNTGVQFLNLYAKKYDLLSKFLLSNKSKIVYPNTSLLTDIRSTYRVRDYNNYVNWELHAIVDRNPFSNDTNVGTGYYAMNASLEYVPEDLRSAAYYNNNRYRYGPNPADRFLAIIFKNDPWLDDDAFVSFLSTPEFHDLSGKNKAVHCLFTYPIQSNSSFQYVPELSLIHI